MTFKIGQKVETPLGVAVIKYYLGGNTTWLSFDENMAEIEFDIKYLKPYKTPHEKLIEMGYEEKIHDLSVEKETKKGDYKQYVNYPSVILIDLDEKDFTTYTLYNDSKNNVDDVSWVSLNLSRILTEYLEWLEENK